jgi:lysozyme family protein
MADFNLAIPTVLQHEGGYVNNSDDPGSETNFGISKRFYPDVDIAALTADSAAAIYRRDFWDPLLLDSVTDQAVATKILDTCVNMGKVRGTTYLQQALNAIGAAVATDGEMGPVTIAAINAADPQTLLAAYRQRLVNFYAALVVERPQDGIFERGWLDRANA